MSSAIKDFIGIEHLKQNLLVLFISRINDVGVNGLMLRTISLLGVNGSIRFFCQVNSSYRCSASEMKSVLRCNRLSRYGIIGLAIWSYET